MDALIPAPTPPPARARVKGGVAPPERVFQGIPVCAGIGIGAVYSASDRAAEIVRRTIGKPEVETELVRLDAAVTQSKKQLQKLRARLSMLPEDTQAEIAPLLDAYIRMIGPTRLLRGVRRRITEGLLGVETAIADEAEALATAMVANQGVVPGAAGSDSRAALQRRADEVREIARRLVRNATRTPFRNFSALPDGAVLAAEALRPADAALLNPARLAAVVADEGGADGHTAVMLRALGIPAVLGAGTLAEAVRPGDFAVVDGGTGRVTLNPSDATMAAARAAVVAQTRERQRYARLRRLPSETQDGEAVELQANLELPIELPLIAQSGAQGIGLLRTEFLFMNRDDVPGEEDQAATYRIIVDAMAGDPVTIRVLDWGGEKEIAALSAAGLVPEGSSPNPAMGVRGIRLLLREPSLLEAQFGAILRASVAGPVRVMLPMVTNADEIRGARDIYDRVARRLRRAKVPMPEKLPPLGVMIETPGAALSADALALEADFFAIGTNDLTAYTLAVDRGETDVAALYDPLHPAVLRLIRMTADAALRARMPVSVCGELAANPLVTRLLLGVGIRQLSMNASAVPRVKQVVRGSNIDDCVRFARRVLEQTDAQAVKALLLGADGA